MADGEIKAIVSADISPFERKLQQARTLADRFYQSVSKPVRLDADITQFRNKLKTAQGLATNFKNSLRKASRFSIDITAARTAIRQVNADVNRVRNQVRKSVGIQVDLKSYRTQLRKVKTITDEFVSKYRPKIKIELDTSTFREQLRRVREEAAALRRNVNQAQGAPAAAQSNQQAAQSAETLGRAQERASTSADRQTEALNRNSAAARRNQQANSQAARGAARFDQVVGGLADSAALVTGPLGGIASRITVLGSSLRAGTLGIVGLATGLTGLGLAIAESAGEAEKFETSQLRLQAQIRATGQAAGVTADEIIEFSNKLGLATLGDPLEIQQTAARLLAFRGLSREVFFDVLSSAQDLAELGFGSLNTAAIALATAATEPERGLSRLERQNIRLSPAIKDTIIALSAQGERLRAQKLLLEEVQKATGGVAESTAVGLAGAFDTAGQRNSEFLQQLAKSVGTLDILTTTVNRLSGSLESLTNALADRGSLATFDPYEVLVARRQVLAERLESDAAKSNANLRAQLERNIDEVNSTLAEKYESLIKQRRLLEKRLAEVKPQRGLFGQERGPSLIVRRMRRELAEISSEIEKYDVLTRDLEASKRSLQELITERDAALARFGSGEGDTSAVSAQIKNLNELIAAEEKRLQILQEQTGSKEAQARAASAQAQAELDAQNAAEKARKAALAEQNRLESLRRVSVRSLREQNEILGRMAMLEGVAAMSAREYAEAKTRVTRAVRLGIADEQETVEVLERQLQTALKIGTAQEINSLNARLSAARARDDVDAYQTANEGLLEIDRRRLALAEQRETDQSELDSLEAQIEAEQRLLDVAHESEEVRKAAQEQAEIDIRLQERRAGLAKQNIELSRAQIEAERASIATLVERESQLEKLQQANEEIEEQQKEALENQKKFQETVASGFTDLLFATESFEDSIKRLIIQLSKAAVEARVLAAIQYSTGTGDGSIGTDSTSGVLGTFLQNAIGSVFSGGKSMFGGAQGAGTAIETPIEGFVAHQGGIVGQIASRRTVAANEFIGAPRFHQGLRQNEMPAILERGEEVIPKDQVKRGRGGDTNITFNVNANDADSFRRSERQMARAARRRISI
jgi:hypothetical protein